MEFSDIQSEYERNNRSNSIKALRCFPRCRQTGHCKSGFCGTSLKCALEVVVDHNSPQCQLEDSFWKSVTYIAEFRESLIPGLSSVRFINRQELENQLRTRTEKFKVLIEGYSNEIVTQEDRGVVTKTINLEFNESCQAWHYGWQSHKYKNDTKHCVDIVVLVENGSDSYFIAASFVSPLFEIVSTKSVQKKLALSDGISSDSHANVADSRNALKKQKVCSEDQSDDEEEEKECAVSSGYTFLFHSDNSFLEIEQNNINVSIITRRLRDLQQPSLPYMVKEV